MKNLNKIILTLFLFILIELTFTGCKKLVEVPPPSDQLTGQTVFANNATAIGFLNGTFGALGETVGYDGFLSISFIAGLSADELNIMSAQTDEYLTAAYTNNFSTSKAVVTPRYWAILYPLIYNANTAIKNLQTNETLSAAVRQQLLGEAKFLRAYFYFYLCNIYGDVPLITTPDYRINASLARTSTEVVYKQIIADLKDSQILLSKNYLDGTLLNQTSDRVRPTYWAATAMLARVYLFNGKDSEAEIESGKIIENSALFSLVDLDQAFLRTSQEAIWQIQSTNLDKNSQEGLTYILSGTPSVFDADRPYFLTADLLNAFEPGDPRKDKWIGSISASGITYSYPFKYKAGIITANNGIYPPKTEFSIPLRLAEVYLIRAESRARQNKVAECVADLNTIRHRARGTAPSTILPDYGVNISATDAVEACIKERRIEFFSEMGHRWFDLKRTGLIDQIMKVVAPLKGGNWESYKQLFPIPVSEIQINKALVQNPGY